MILAVDTATSRVVVAVGAAGGEPLAQAEWSAGYRHGEQLLASVERVLAEANVGRERVRGVVVGTGPGAFTGLRVGLATAKALAHGLAIPIVGVSTAAALLAAASDDLGMAQESLVLLQPAGPADRVATRAGEPSRLLPGGTQPDLADGDVLVAVDLDGRAPEEAVAAGDRARRRLGAELLRLGAARLAGGDADEAARLVPEYVTLPRGVRAAGGEMAWSRDPR